jgi:hypothetical protein
MNKIASILCTLKVTLLIKPYDIAYYPALDKASWMSLIILLGAKKAISSIKDSAIISKFCFSIFSNIPLRYIMNRIGDTRDPYSIPEFVSFNKQVNLSITS